ncbi:hypothetical protein OZX68_06425 [Streptococcaceae bacterium ESL0729]|nr:hypothetical protein OZX68_06425 [Streptococcaceae bacterium ESL0729]
MSQAFEDVEKMKKIKEDVKNHEGQVVGITSQYGRKRENRREGTLSEVYDSLFIVVYDQDSRPKERASYSYSDILTENILIHYADQEEAFEVVEIDVDTEE